MSSYKYKTSGVCASSIDIDVKDGKIYDIVFTGGCNGNLQGISALVKGLELTDVIAKLKGISCSGKPTSCPDQLAIALGEILKSENRSNL